MVQLLDQARTSVKRKAGLRNRLASFWPLTGSTADSPEPGANRIGRSLRLEDLMSADPDGFVRSQRQPNGE